MPEMFEKAKAAIDQLKQMGSLKVPEGAKVDIVEMEDDLLDGLQRIKVKIDGELFNIDVPTQKVSKIGR